MTFRIKGICPKVFFVDASSGRIECSSSLKHALRVQKKWQVCEIDLSPCTDVHLGRPSLNSNLELTAGTSPCWMSNSEAWCMTPLRFEMSFLANLVTCTAESSEWKLQKRLSPIKEKHASHFWLTYKIPIVLRCSRFCLLFANTHRSEAYSSRKEDAHDMNTLECAIVQVPSLAACGLRPQYL